MKKVCIFLILLHLTLGALYYPNKLEDTRGYHSNQPLSALSLQDQKEGEDDWNKYIEFNSSRVAYSGVFTFKYEPIINDKLLIIIINRY